MGTRGESTVTGGIPQPSALVQDRPVAGRLLNVTAQHDPAHSRIPPDSTVGSAVIFTKYSDRGCRSHPLAAQSPRHTHRVCAVRVILLYYFYASAHVYCDIKNLCFASL